MNQRPSDQRTLRFPGGHLRYWPVRKMRDAQATERSPGALQPFRLRPMVREDSRAAEKAGEHDVSSGGVARAGDQKIRRDDPKKRTQVEDIPAFPAKNVYRRSVPS